MIYALEGHVPAIDPTAWVAAEAALIGKVVIEAEASVWFHCTLRGDNEEIRLGPGSNLQENVVCHTDPGFPLIVGRDVTVGHKAMLHGCEIGDGCLIGMGALILNGARIGAGSLIGAGALVKENAVIPPGSMVVGSPGRVIRELDAERQAKMRHLATRYQANARRFRAGLAPL
ncbi:gamma carbonic anhydrase family protein [Frigidibacter sp. MR17.24]|uniref:gamma carbonic anhydrase family protein n=1 Tax=Frigidibacter sp. MR17.24 TaxID=3127345 RepID=UPI0030131197